MKLIDKDTLVAEIRNKVDSYKGDGIISISVLKQHCEDFIYSLDTLEVKKVDLEHLEQEVKDFCYEYDDRKEKWYELCPNDRKLLYNPTWANFAMCLSKHFFELGMAVSNKAQKGEET